MIKKNILSILFCITLSMGTIIAQHKHGDFDIEQYKKDKAAFVIQEARLTPDEAQRFIPLLNELAEKRFEVNRLVRIKSRDLKKKGNATDTDYQKVLDLGVEAGLKEAQLNKEYNYKFQKVLSAEKIYKSKIAEEKFIQKTIAQIRKNKQCEK